jgi:hypothetical protein
MEPLFNPKQAADLSNLLAAVSAEDHLGSGYRNEADYWASQVRPGLHASEVHHIALLLEDVAGSPWLSEPVQQWAKAWIATIRELADVQGAV